MQLACFRTLCHEEHDRQMQHVVHCFWQHVVQTLGTMRYCTSGNMVNVWPN